MSALVVHIWRDCGNEAGHASLQLSDGTYISWFPSNPGTHKGLAAQNTTLERDLKNQKHVQRVAYAIESTAFSEPAITEWWRLFQKETKEWIHLERNGPLVVFEALSAGNSKKKDSGRHTTLTPTDLEMELKEYNMSTLVAYIWREKGTEVGHASLQLTDGTYISWFPSNRGENTCPAAKNVTFEDDVKNLKNILDFAYAIEPAAFFERRINEWWQLFKKENTEWINLERNGPLVVFEALYAGNVKMDVLKKHMGNKGSLNTLTPTGLEAALKEHTQIDSA